jgi:hypothetical protein
MWNRAVRCHRWLYTKSEIPPTEVDGLFKSVLLNGYRENLLHPTHGQWVDVSNPFYKTTTQTSRRLRSSNGTKDLCGGANILGPFACRKDLNDPLTAVSGISLLYKAVTDLQAAKRPGISLIPRLLQLISTAVEI